MGCRWSPWLFVPLLACGGDPASVIPQPGPTPTPTLSHCAGVRGPVLALVLGGGSALLPPEDNPEMEQLATRLRTGYSGSWDVRFSVRATRSVDGLGSLVASFLNATSNGEVLFVGHSSGGADADAIARALPSAAGRFWLITIDPVRDTVAFDAFETLDSPLGADGPRRHRHFIQPAPGPTLAGTNIQLGVKLDYRPATVRRSVLTQYDHSSIKAGAMPQVVDEVESGFGACPR